MGQAAARPGRRRFPPRPGPATRPSRSGTPRPQVSRQPRDALGQGRCHVGLVGHLGHTQSGRVPEDKIGKARPKIDSQMCAHPGWPGTYGQQGRPPQPDRGKRAQGSVTFCLSLVRARSPSPCRGPRPHPLDGLQPPWPAGPGRSTVKHALARPLLPSGQISGTGQIFDQILQAKANATARGSASKDCGERSFPGDIRTGPLRISRNRSPCAGPESLSP